MIIWIDGAFGVGKTEVADALVTMVEGDAMVYDPELVGYMLRHAVPDSETDDFQDLPIWRTLVGDMAVALDRHYAATLVVPMTITNPNYLSDITERFASKGLAMEMFTLTVDRDELVRRTTDHVAMDEDRAVDERVREWRLSQVDRCLAAFAIGEFGIDVPNVGRPPEATAAAILDRLGSNPVAP